jgi:hypothetical protein
MFFIFLINLDESVRPGEVVCWRVSLIGKQKGDFALPFTLRSCVRVPEHGCTT